MHPDLFSIEPITIHTYGVMVAIGFLLGIGLALRQARKEGIPSEKISDLSFYLLLAAIIGSRIFYILLNPGPYIKNPVAILKIWEGGLVFYGGLIFAVITGVIYIKRHNLFLWQIADIFAPSIAVEVIGQLEDLEQGAFLLDAAMEDQQTFHGLLHLQTPIPLHPLVWPFILPSFMRQEVSL
jgi:phosphatidylglycerol:prolipoprotein diacylglycerol transferase